MHNYAKNNSLNQANAKLGIINENKARTNSTPQPLNSFLMSDQINQQKTRTTLIPSFNTLNMRNEKENIGESSLTLKSDNSSFFKNNTRYTEFNENESKKKSNEAKFSSNIENSVAMLESFQEILNQNNSLESELDHVKEELLRKNVELENYISTIDILKDKLNIYQDEYQVKDSDNGNIITNTAMLSTMIDKIKAKNIFLETQLNEYIDKIARLENEKIHFMSKSYSYPKEDHSSDPNSITTTNNATLNHIHGGMISNDSIKGGGDNEDYHRLKEVELEKLQLEENYEYICEKHEHLQEDYNNVKEQLDLTINKYEGLLNTLKVDEEEKIKYITIAKRLEEQLKNANYNILNLNKKCSVLEKDNKDMHDQIKTIQIDKKNYLDKCNKLSNKGKIEEKLRQQIKNMEIEIGIKTNEIEEIRDKYTIANTELVILKETEKTYKELIENKSEIIKDLQDKLEIEEKERKNIMKQNMDFMEKLELNRIDTAIKNTVKEKEILDAKREKLDTSKLSTHTSTSTTINRFEKDKADYKQKVDDSMKLINQYDKKLIETENLRDKILVELNQSNKRYELLKQDYENLNKEYGLLMAEKQAETQLLDNLQKKKGNLNSLSSRDLKLSSAQGGESIYNIEKDEHYLRLVQLLEKNEEGLQSLFKLIQNIKIKHQNSEDRMRYDRLLVKYYHSIEKLKSLKKTKLNTTNSTITMNNENLKSALTTTTNQNYTNDQQVLPYFLAKNANSRKSISGNLNQTISPSQKNEMLLTKLSNQSEQEIDSDHDISHDNKENNNLKPRKSIGKDKKIPEKANKALNMSSENIKNSQKIKAKLNLGKTMALARAKALGAVESKAIPTSEDSIGMTRLTSINTAAIPDSFEKSDLMRKEYKTNETLSFYDEDVKLSGPMSYEKLYRSNESVVQVSEDQQRNALTTMGNDRRSRIIDHSSKKALQDIVNISVKKERESTLRGSSSKSLNKTYSDIHQNRKSISNSFNVSK